MDHRMTNDIIRTSHQRIVVIAPRSEQVWACWWQRGRCRAHALKNHRPEAVGIAVETLNRYEELDIKSHHRAHTRNPNLAAQRSQHESMRELRLIHPDGWTRGGSKPGRPTRRWSVPISPSAAPAWTKTLTYLLTGAKAPRFPSPTPTPKQQAERRRLHGLAGKDRGKKGCAPVALREGKETTSNLTRVGGNVDWELILSHLSRNNKIVRQNTMLIL